MSDSRTRAVVHQYFVRASPDRVFRALSDPAWLVKWLADSAELEPRKGGRYRLSWTDGPSHTGTVLEFEAGKRIALEWAWPGVELAGTVWRLSVEPLDEGSLLKVDHTGFPMEAEWVDLYGGTEWGWTYFAMNLKSVLETGRDLRSPHDG